MQGFQAMTQKLRQAPFHIQLRQVRWLVPLIVLILAALHQALVHWLADPLPTPWMTRSVPLFDAGARVGTIEVSRSLRPLLFRSGILLFALLSAGYLIHRERLGSAFVMTTLTILFTVATLFVALYPRVMVSSLDPAWSLTIYNASSTPYTLRIMSIVAAIFVPVVLAYQAWTYWVFRHRVGAEDVGEVRTPLDLLERRGGQSSGGEPAESG